jgi:hypothetical protein
MEAKRTTWADSDSESEDSFDDERQVTALPNIQDSGHTEVRKKSKKKHHEEEEKLDPNLVTKIEQPRKPAPKVYLRADGTPMSKKEIKQKELEEMDSLFDEFGIDETQPTHTQTSNEPQTEGKKTKGQSRPAKRSAAVDAVRAEISARQEKAKKKKSKQQFPY